MAAQTLPFRAGLGFWFARECGLGVHFLWREEREEDLEDDERDEEERREPLFDRVWLSEWPELLLRERQLAAEDERWCWCDDEVPSARLD